MRNCFSTRANGTMKYMNGTTVPTGSRYGGVFGLLAGDGSRVMDCYYRCDAAGTVTSPASVGTNFNQLSEAQIVTQTTKVSVTIECNGQGVTNYFRIALTFGARKTDKTTKDSYTASNGDEVELSEWLLNEGSSSYSYHMPVQISLYNLGTAFYYD